MWSPGATRYCFPPLTTTAVSEESGLGTASDCTKHGDLSVPMRYAPAPLRHRLDQPEGRQSADQVTVFDSTGIALQDSATVPLEYERAVAAGVGVEKKMIST